MDFTFSEDQFAFRDAVSRFLMTEAAPELLRDIWETESGRSEELRSKLAAQGLTALSVPEAEGGLGQDDLDWALLSQEVGYYALPDSLTDSACVAVGVLAALPAGHALRSSWLPRVADGSAQIALGHPVNPWVADAAAADLLLRVESGATPRMHALPREPLGLHALRSIDTSRRLADVPWTPQATTCIAEGPAALAMADAMLDRAALCVSGQLVGLAQRMLDLSVDYVSQRKQFGKVIGSFQAVKHHLADVVTKIAFAKPVLYRAALALQGNEPQRALYVSHAKLVCSDAALTAARKGIQVHGAMGYTWEVDLQMFMKRAWALDGAWGDRAFHRQRLGAQLLDGDAPLGPGATFNL